MVIAGAFFPYYFVQEQLDEQKINRDINENDPHSTVMVRRNIYDNFNNALYMF